MSPQHLNHVHRHHRTGSSRSLPIYRRPDPLFVLLFALAVVVILSLLAPPAGAYELRLSTENDLLVTDQDDLYTFAVSLQLQRGPYAISLRENAFTDRAAGLRLDESQLTVGRRLPLPGPWAVYAEGGAVRVGRGLFGERAQNAVHGLIGGESVRLPYVSSSLHPRAALTAQRSFTLAQGLDLGPRLELDTIPRLRSHAVVAAQLAWQPRREVALHALIGARFTDAAHAALEPHLVGRAPVARITLLLFEALSLDWSYNDYGDGRDHISLGYRVRGGALRGPRR